MAKYIDADLLRKEIEKRKNICNGVYERDSDTYYQGKAVAYQETLSLIDSLQHEQPSEELEEEQERNLDFQCFAKEMDSVFALPASETTNTKDEPLKWEYAIARHFYELGKGGK